MKFLLITLITLFTASHASAFGSKRIVENFESNQEWKQGNETLLNGFYDDGHGSVKMNPALFGAIQTGPLRVKEDGHDWVWMTMIDRDDCHLLRKDFKNISKINEPTKLSKTKCSIGKDFRKKAKVPPFTSYSPLSADGKKLLFSAVFDRDWKAEKECTVDGREKNELFTQTLKLHFEPRWTKNDKDELDVISNARAFSSKKPLFMKEARISPIKILKFGEYKDNNGVYRFLIWGDRFDFNTEAQNGIQIASVNTLFMNPAHKLTFYSNSRICADETCYPLSETETTSVYSAHAIVLEFDPKKSDSLGVHMLRVNNSTPIITLRYSN